MSVAPPSSGPELDFQDFSQKPEYVEENRALIKRLLPFSNPFFHVDIATGTGLIPKLILEEAQRTKSRGTIIGIDPNPVSLKIAQETVEPSKSVTVGFVDGLGQNACAVVADRLPSQGADSVSIHDAIHEIPGEDLKRKVFEQMAKMLRGGGLLSYNSAFTTRAVTTTPMLWGRWKAYAFAIMGAKRDKNVEPLRIHSPEEYRSMITDAGLKIEYEASQDVELTHGALEAISRYPAFVEGVFRDMMDEAKVSIEEKSAALIAAVDRLGSEVCIRTWHRIIASKPIG